MSDSKNSENAATISAIVESPADIIDKSIDRNSEAKSETECNETMSKRKQKKLLKMARYQEMKKLKRQKEKQKYKEKRKAEAAAGVAGPGRERKLRKLNTMENSSNKVSVAIDFDYDELMSDKDIAKCVKQLLRVYTLNRKSSMPIQLHYTSLNETNRVKQALAKNIGYENWDVNIHQETYLDLFSHDRIVYLSSESENVLEELDLNAVYIIGGLVDHNHHKGLSLDRAEKKSLKTARLPLNEYISMKTRTVLTIVHVFEILLNISEGKPWKETLLEVLPQRKFKSNDQNGKEEYDSDENANSSSDDEEKTERSTNDQESNVES